VIDNPAPSTTGWPFTIIPPVFNWLRSFFAPVAIVRECIKNNLQDDLTNLFGQYWAVPGMAILATNAFVLHQFGIEIKSDPVLIALYLLVACGRLIFEAFVLVIVLWLLKLRVQQGLVLVCYTIAVVYAPLFNWLSIPASLHQHAILSFIKNQNVETGDLFSYFFKNIEVITGSTGSAFPKYWAEIGAANWCMNLISGTLVAECISQAGNVRRQRVYVAVFLAQVADVIPTVLLTLVQTLITFSYMHGM
jgi:hypothetical protein